MTIYSFILPSSHARLAAVIIENFYTSIASWSRRAVILPIRSLDFKSSEALSSADRSHKIFNVGTIISLLLERSLFDKGSIKLLLNHLSSKS